MDWFRIIKEAYDRGVNGYSDEGVKLFVVKGKITAEQYKGITNKTFSA